MCGYQDPVVNLMTLELLYVRAVIKSEVKR
jgi:hypothetical protein